MENHLPNNNLSWTINTDVAASVADQEHQVVTPISVAVPDDEEVLHNEESNFAERSQSSSDESDEDSDDEMDDWFQSATGLN